MITEQQDILISKFLSDKINGNSDGSYSFLVDNFSDCFIIDLSGIKKSKEGDFYATLTVIDKDNNPIFTSRLDWSKNYERPEQKRNDHLAYIALYYRFDFDRDFKEFR